MTSLPKVPLSILLFVLLTGLLIVACAEDQSNGSRTGGTTDSSDTGTDTETDPNPADAAADAPNVDDVQLDGPPNDSSDSREDGGARDAADATPEDGGQDAIADATVDIGENPCSSSASMVLWVGSEQATLDGWYASQSTVGEGHIISPCPDPSVPCDPPPDASAEFTIDIPCDDTWTVWVRGLDDGPADSYYVQVNGAPEPPVIFELDCAAEGSQYVWGALNARQEGAPVCDNTPWPLDLRTGPLELTFYPRESPILARIIVTNDPDFVPRSND